MGRCWNRNITRRNQKIGKNIMRNQLIGLSNEVVRKRRSEINRELMKFPKKIILVAFFKMLSLK